MKKLMHSRPGSGGSRAAAQDKNKSAPWEERRRQAELLWKRWREWSFIHLRRTAHLLHGSLANRRAVGPVSFLTVCAALGVALTLTTLYTPSYAVLVDGEQVGVVADQSVVDQAIATVESQGSQLLGYDYQVDAQVDYEFGLSWATSIRWRAMWATSSL